MSCDVSHQRPLWQHQRLPHVNHSSTVGDPPVGEDETASEEVLSQLVASNGHFPVD